jgi:hypothetical protein
MTDFTLQPNEGVILKSEGGVYLTDKKNRSNAHTAELILTNLNLIWIKTYGMFGNKKETQYYPLNQIKVIDGKAQVRVAEDSSTTLEIYLFSQQLTFDFSLRSDLKKFANAIYKQVTGEDVDIAADEPTFLGSLAAGVADNISDVFGSFKNAWGAKNTEKKSISKKCLSCGAPISGYEGQSTHCPYCNTEQTL